MHECGKSDQTIVPLKERNNGKTMKSKAQTGESPSPSPAEALEGRPVTEGNSGKTDCDLHAVAGVSIERT